MRSPLGAFVRVRLLWLPVAGLLFGTLVVGAGTLPVSDALGVVVAGFLTVLGALGVGLLLRFLG